MYGETPFNTARYHHRRHKHKVCRKGCYGRIEEVLRIGIAPHLVVKSEKPENHSKGDIQCHKTRQKRGVGALKGKSPPVEHKGNIV